MRPVVLLEFNELSPALMARFLEEGRLPNFRRLHDESQVFTTRAIESPPALEPWIQWVNVHTGLDFADHGIFSLDQGHKLEQPAVWDFLSRAGLRVLVFGSMNVRYDLPLNGCVVPDPWTTRLEVHPNDLEPYFRFVQRNVLDYTGRVSLGLGDRLRFLSFMVSHGLSLETVWAVARQMASDRLGGRWKRAALLDKLQYDVFAWYYRRLRPHFSTFFLNSTAHFQHLYWRSHAPDLFQVKPSPDDVAEHGSAIQFGYQEMDRLLGRFFDLVGPDAVVVFCTALSQQPCLTYEESGGKLAYRPHDFEALLGLAGVAEPHRVSPVMAEEFHIYFERGVDCSATEERLRSLRVREQPVLRLRREEGGLLAGCGIFHEVPPDAMVTGGLAGKSAPFFDLFYLIDGKKSGMHHPDGLLWIRTPEKKHEVIGEKVPLTSIAPTLLRLFKMEPPAFMRGKSLLDAA